MSDTMDAAAETFTKDIAEDNRPAVRHNPVVEHIGGGDIEDDEVAGGDVEDDVPSDLMSDPEWVEEDEQPQQRKPAPQEEEDDQGVDEEEEEDEQKYTLTVDGEQVEVGLKEMQEGYIRTATFHQRLNKLHEASDVIRREAQGVMERRDKTLAMYEEVETLLKGLTPNEPNWDEEYARDPKQARVLQKQFEDFAKQRKALEEQHGKLKAEKENEEFQRLQQWADQENAKIPQIFPTWSDDKVRERDMTSMRRTAKAAGFSDDEINGIIDTRYLVLLNKAATLDRMQARRAQPNPNKGPGKLKANPGAGSTRTAPKGMARAQKHLSKTGSVESAGQIFAGLIERE